MLQLKGMWKINDCDRSVFFFCVSASCKRVAIKRNVEEKGNEKKKNVDAGIKFRKKTHRRTDFKNRQRKEEKQKKKIWHMISRMHFVEHQKCKQTYFFRFFLLLLLLHHISMHGKCKLLRKGYNTKEKNACQFFFIRQGFNFVVRCMLYIPEKEHSLNSKSIN